MNTHDTDKDNHGAYGTDYMKTLDLRWKQWKKNKILWLGAIKSV